MTNRTTIALSILTTSDVHGHLLPTDYRGAGPKPLGLARLAGLIAREREQADAALLIDNGDLLQGTPLAYVAAKRAALRAAHPAIAALNHLRYDAAVVGNHEFNYGRGLLEEAVAQSAFPWLAANVADHKSGDPAFGRPYIVRKLGEDGPTVAVLGVTTHYIPHWERPEHIEGLTFRDARETVRIWVEKIKREERPDALIVCYHGGFERDVDTGIATEEIGRASCRERV